MKFGIFLFLLISSFFLLHSSLLTQPVHSQQDCAIQTTPRVERGLISAKQTVSSDFSSDTGSCIVNNEKAAFADFQIPTYSQLKNQFFTQAKNVPNSVQKTIITRAATQADINLTGSTDHLVNINGDLTITSNPTLTKSGVIFVDGNLYLGPSLPANTFGNATSNVVFIVSGDIQIDVSVSQVNAVLIAFGVVCTASESNTCPPGLTTPLPNSSRLIVNGSIISFNKTATPPIRFRRTLVNNTQAAEFVNSQVKYLVILKNLFSQTLEIRTEL